MRAVLDTGALIAVDRRSRAVGAVLRVLQRDGIPVLTSAGAVAQAWREGRRQAHLGRALSGIAVVALDDPGARRVGELLRNSGTSDVVDAHVALLVQPDDRVLTSDGSELAALLRIRRVKAPIIPV